MTVSETLEQVQFVVGPDGQPTAALVEISAWQALVSMLEEAGSGRMSNDVAWEWLRWQVQPC